MKCEFGDIGVKLVGDNTNKGGNISYQKLLTFDRYR
jgi:hypothetical protein